MTYTGALRDGSTRSCGCRIVEAARERLTTHGKTDTKVFGIWKAMLARCFNRKRKGFKNYGGRGITVCERWLKFENFYSDMGDPPPKRFLDREDNDGNYEPSNCRWVTRSVQNSNTRRNVLMTYRGRTQTVTAWSKELGTAKSLLLNRYEKYGNLDRIREGNYRYHQPHNKEK